MNRTLFHRSACMLAVASLLFAIWGSTARAQDGPDESSDVTLSFHGTLIDFGSSFSGWDPTVFGSVTVNGDCSVLDGTFNASGRNMDDLINLEGSQAASLVARRPTLFVNDSNSSSVAAVAFNPDGTVTGTTRVEVDENTLVYARIDGSWFSGKPPPGCVKKPVEKETTPKVKTPGEPAIPDPPTVDSVTPTIENESVANVKYTAGNNWAPPGGTTDALAEIVGLEYRLNDGKWTPLVGTGSRHGTFTVGALTPNEPTTVETRVVGLAGVSPSSTPVTVTVGEQTTGRLDNAIENDTQVSDTCASQPTPAVTIDDVQGDATVGFQVTYSLTANDSATFKCLDKLTWSLTGGSSELYDQRLDLTGVKGTKGLDVSSSFTVGPAVVKNNTTLVMASHNSFNPSAKQTDSVVLAGQPAPLTTACASSPASRVELGVATPSPDGAWTVGYTLLPPPGGRPGDCVTSIEYSVLGTDLVHQKVSGPPYAQTGFFDLPATLDTGEHILVVVANNATNPNQPQSSDRIKLYVPAPGETVKLGVSYPVDSYIFMVGADVHIPATAVTSTTPTVFAPGATLPAGMFLNPQTGEVFGAAMEPTGGTLTVPVIAKNFDSETRTTLSLRVNESDDRQLVDDTALKEDTPLKSSPSGVVDPDDSNLVLYPADAQARIGEVTLLTPHLVDEVAGGFTLEGDSPAGLHINPGTGALSWDGKDTEPRKVSVTVGYSYVDAVSKTQKAEIEVSFTVVDPALIPAAGDNNQGSCLSNTGQMYHNVQASTQTSFVLAPDVSEDEDVVGFSLASGFLPQGVVLDNDTGVIMGSTSDSQSLGKVVVEAEFSDRRVKASEALIEVVDTSLVGVSYPNFVTAVSGEGLLVPATVTEHSAELYFTLTCGSLPDGLHLDDRTGEISGTVKESAPWSEPVTVRVETEIGFLDFSMLFEVTSSPGFWVRYPASTTMRGNQRADILPSLSPSQPPAGKYTVVNGQLPAGLQLNSDTGAVVGTPIRASNGPESVTVVFRGDDSKVLASAMLVFSVEASNRQGSNWWLLWFLVTGAGLVYALVVELGKKKRESHNQVVTGVNES